MPQPNQAFAAAVAEWVREIRKRASFSKPQLATEAGVANDTVYRLEKGLGADVTLDTLERLAKACGVPAPAIGRVLLLSESPQEPVSARGWVEQAQSALERATRLLAAQDAAQRVTARAEAVKTARLRRKRSSSSFARWSVGWPRSLGLNR